MKKILLILFLSITTNIFPEDMRYFSATKKEIIENFSSLSNGFIFEFDSPKKQYTIIIHTNENFATMNFTHIVDNQTNNYFLKNNRIITPKKEINLKNLELILFPEVQLQNFVKDSTQQEICYMGMRLEKMKAYATIAKKIAHTNNSTKVQVTFKNVPATFVKFIYYFNSNGIAISKEGYFAGSKTPKYHMIKNY